MLGLPPDALIVSATLQVYIHNCYTCHPTSLTVYRVSEPWQEMTATWNSTAHASAETFDVQKLSVSSVGHWVSFDVTRLVGYWVRGVPNNGVMVRGSEAPLSQLPLVYDYWGIEAREGEAFPPRLVVYWLPH